MAPEAPSEGRTAGDVTAACAPDDTKAALVVVAVVAGPAEESWERILG